MGRFFMEEGEGRKESYRGKGIEYFIVEIRGLVAFF